MDSLVTRLTTLLGLLGIPVSAIVYAYSTFATVKYVDDRHTEVVERISEIKDVSDKTQAMVFELLTNDRRRKK